MFLAGGIVTALFGAVLGGGYLVYRYQAAQGPRDDKPPADAPEPKKAKATKAKEESKESKESKEEKRAARAARGEAEKAEALEKMEAELLIARQEVLAQAENEGLTPQATKARMWALEQEHTDRIALTETLEAIENEASRAGLRTDELQFRQQQAVNCHKEIQQMRQMVQRDLQALDAEAVKEGCLPAERRRRRWARQTLAEEERKLRQKLCDNMLKISLDKGLKDESVQKAMMQQQNDIKQEFAEKTRNAHANEKRERQASLRALQELRELTNNRYPAKAKQLLRSRVRIDGLKARPELNGRCGMAAAYKPAIDGKPGRLGVMVDGESAPVLLKLEALTAVNFDDQPLVLSEATAAADDDDGPPPLL